jgi:hypothetical protein
MNQKKTILILSANPQDTGRLRLDEEVREIQEGLKRSKYREQFTIQQAWAVRLRDFRRALLEHEPQIVHFCGHGNVDGIAIEDEQGNSSVISSEALAGLFRLFTQVECVILNACYSESQANAINVHISYVVGMSQSITDKAGIEFAVGFYDALGAGKNYEEAFSFGCNAIELYHFPEFSTPVFKKKPLDIQYSRSQVTGEYKQKNSSLGSILTSINAERDNIFSSFADKINASYASILKEPPQRIKNILSQANIYFDPSYDLEYYYPKLDILVLLFDHVIVHSPQNWHFNTEGKKNIYQTGYSSERFLQFVENGFVTPCTVAHPNDIWNPKTQGDFGKRILESKNYIYKPEMADVGLYEDLRREFDNLDEANPKVFDILSESGWGYCYPTQEEIKRHNQDADYGIRRFIHEINGDFLFTKLIDTPELLKPSFVPIWQHKMSMFSEMCYSYAKDGDSDLSSDAFTEILSKESLIPAFIEFIKTKNLIIPRNLSIKQIEQFRKEGENRSMRKFLRNAYEHSQEVRELPLDFTLINDFNNLWNGYVTKRDTITVALQSFIGSALISYATYVNPALGAGVAAGVIGTWAMASDLLKKSINETGKKFSDSSWMLYLLEGE